MNISPMRIALMNSTGNSILFHMNYKTAIREEFFSATIDLDHILNYYWNVKGSVSHYQPPELSNSSIKVLQIHSVEIWAAV